MWPEDVEHPLHVRDIDGAGEIGEDADDLVVAASTFKVAVALAFFDLVASGAIDPTERVSLPPGARTDGPTGISILKDEVSLTLRDAAALMLTVSDNAATDAVLARVGVDLVHERLRGLGFVDTYLVGGCQQLMDAVANDLGFPEWGALPAAVGEVSADELLRSRTFRSGADDADDGARANRAAGGDLARRGSSRGGLRRGAAAAGAPGDTPPPGFRL